jgi:hypothetical protein
LVLPVVLVAIFTVFPLGHLGVRSPSSGGVTLGLDKDIQLGGGGGSSSGESGDPIPGVYIVALEKASSIRSVGAQVLLELGFLVLLVAYVRKKGTLLTIAAFGWLLFLSVYVTRQDVDRQVSLLQIPLRGMLDLSYSPSYWAALLAGVAMGVGAAIVAWRTGRRAPRRG